MADQEAPQQGLPHRDASAPAVAAAEAAAEEPAPTEAAPGEDAAVASVAEGKEEHAAASEVDEDAGKEEAGGKAEEISPVADGADETASALEDASAGGELEPAGRTSPSVDDSGKEAGEAAGEPAVADEEPAVEGGNGGAAAGGGESGEEEVDRGVEGKEEEGETAAAAPEVVSEAAAADEKEGEDVEKEVEDAPAAAAEVPPTEGAVITGGVEDDGGDAAAAAEEKEEEGGAAAVASVEDAADAPAAVTDEDSDGERDGEVAEAAAAAAAAEEESDEDTPPVAAADKASDLEAGEEEEAAPAPAVAPQAPPVAASGMESDSEDEADGAAVAAAPIAAPQPPPPELSSTEASADKCEAERHEGSSGAGQPLPPPLLIEPKIVPLASIPATEERKAEEAEEKAAVEELMELSPAALRRRTAPKPGKRRAVVVKRLRDSGALRLVEAADVDSVPLPELLGEEWKAAAPAPVILLLGSVGLLPGTRRDGMYRLFNKGVVRAAARSAAAVVDGGCDNSMSALAAGLKKQAFLCGVAPHRVLELGPCPSPHHARQLVVGDATHWGDEAAARLALVRRISGNGAATVVCLLAAGGDSDAWELLTALRAGWHVVALQGSGGLADELSDAAHRGPSVPWAGELLGAGRLSKQDRSRVSIFSPQGTPEELAVLLRLRLMAPSLPASRAGRAAE
eukprot:PLAT3597.1.p1 GENE.PLAT3597.1~~PLAT3597.1.p1  ORF type:complete len:684 (+),score=247.65 PLAT3597.1:47-2098(+)